MRASLLLHDLDLHRRSCRSRRTIWERRIQQALQLSMALIKRVSRPSESCEASWKQSECLLIRESKCSSAAVVRYTNYETLFVVSIRILLDVG